MAVQIIKSIARRPWSGREHTRDTWYQPLEDQPDIERAVSFVLSHAGVFLNTASDLDLLPRVLKAVSRAGERPTDEDLQGMANERGMEVIFEEHATIT